MPVPNTFANATTSIPLSQLDANFATAITLGNTAIQLGNTVSTLNNMTLANVTISSGTVTVANVTVTGVGTFAAGSNTAPSITTAGDTNTGIYFPAADTIAFTDGGVESMRIDSSGNVGIGNSAPVTRLDVTGIATVRSNSAAWNAAPNTNYGLNFQAASTGTCHITAFSAGGTADLSFATTNGGALAIERARITTGGDFQFNSGYGSVATAYGCRVWVNFNGTGTVAIRASGNVTSITDNGTGEYTVNLTTALTDANYSVVGSCGTGAAGGDDFNLTTNYNAAPTTSAVRIGSQRANSGVATDAAYISLAIFR